MKKKSVYREYPQELIDMTHSLYDFGCSRTEIKEKCKLTTSNLDYILYRKVPSSAEIHKPEPMISAPKLPRKKTILEIFLEFFTLKEHK